MKHEHSIYGHFPGGDPRRFSPGGEEDASEEERAACEAWDAAEKEGKPAPESLAACRAIPGLGHITLSGFGLGVYSYDCDDPECPEAQEPPDDPDDANAAFARWWSFDGQVEEAQETTREELSRIAFLAGFRARMDLEGGETS